MTSDGGANRRGARSERLQRLIYGVVVLPLWRLWDAVCAKRNDHWGFATHHIKSDSFIENPRAVFEYVKADKSIRKVIFTRGDPADFEIENATNFEVCSVKTLRGLVKLSRCGVFFLSHSFSMDISLRWRDRGFTLVKPSLRGRCVVNLWHGIPLKALIAVANPEVRGRTDRVPFRRRERKFYAGLVASSAIDSYAMATMFQPITYDRVWVTGLPRNDFLAMPEGELPKHLRGPIERIQALKGDRRLVIYAPTYRQAEAVDGSSYYQFATGEMDELKAVLSKHHAVLGVRLHYFRNSDRYFNIEDYIDNETIFDMGHGASAEIAPLIREADVVITDYSSVYIDALYLNKAVLGFTYDREHYEAKEDGLLYDMAYAFPGFHSGSFAEVVRALDTELERPSQATSDRYVAARKMFFKHVDTNNAERVYHRVLRQLEGRT